MAQIMKGVSAAQYVGGYLKSELKKRKWSQAYFAEMVGVEDRTVRRWIHDGVHSLDVTFEIAGHLGVSIRDIFSDGDDVPYVFIYRIQQRKKGHRVSFFLFENLL